MNQQKKKILVIDDEPDHLFIAREVLNAEGYEILTHQSPLGALALIEAATPDLILMDVHMPSFPGIDLAAHLRASDATRNIPVVLYSSADELTLVAAVAKYRLSGYICKGDNSDLRRKAAYFLGSHLTDAFTFRKLIYAVE